MVPVAGGFIGLDLPGAARMTTTAQRPLRGSHSSVCAPAPLVDASQKRWEPGLSGVRVPALRW